MSKKDAYQESVKQQFAELIDSLEVKERQKSYLKARWLDQVLWMEGRATRARNFYYRLRLTTIIGGVIIPALVSLNLAGNENPNVKTTLFWTTFGFSQAVAISAAVEQFFSYGDRWRHYRRSVETLKTQGWQFFELTGPYEVFKTHDMAFSEFAGTVEEILQREVEVYSTQVVQAKKDSTSQKPAAEASENVDDGIAPAHAIVVSPASSTLTVSSENGDDGNSTS